MLDSKKIQALQMPEIPDRTLPYSYFSKLESAFLAAFVMCYSVIFAAAVPSGDGYRNESAIAAGEVAINPNHLLLEPAVYFVTWLLKSLGMGYKPFLSSHILAACTAFLTLLLFVRFLRQVGIRSDKNVYISVAGLAASFAFLAQMLDDEPYLLQLPLLILAVGSLVRATDIQKVSDKRQLTSCGSAGLLMGTACLVSIHNVAFAVLAGLVLYLLSFGSRPSIKLAIYAASGLVVAAAFLGIAYLYVDPGSGFITWVTTYETDSEGSAALWSTQLSFSGIVIALLKVLSAIPNALAMDPGFTTYAKELVLETGDYQPSLSLGVVGAILTATSFLALSTTIALAFFARGGRRAVYLCLTGMISYIAFGMIWNVRGTQFWVPCLVVFWPVVGIVLHHGVSFQGTIKKLVPRITRIYGGFTSAFIVVIFVANTTFSVAPNALVDFERMRDDYTKIIMNADVLIVPGWDHQWMLEVHRQTDAEIYYLMDMGLRNYGQPEIGELGSIIENHLRAGDTILVSRLFDIDREPRPWADLRTMGWPREKIVDLFEGYCAIAEGTVEQTVIRKVKRCD